MEIQIDLKYLQSETLKACHPELRQYFEPMILATQGLPEVHALAGITLNLVRLSIETETLCRAGLTDESWKPYRTATESIVNLLYIMYVGPKLQGLTRTRLAQQFAAYGDVAYLKMLQKRPAQARAARKRQGMSDAEFDAFVVEKEQADQAAKALGCLSSRWHPKNLQDMAALVRDNAPDFVQPDQIADQAFSTFVSANSATHGDALALRTRYKGQGNKPLELKFNEDPIHAEIVATMTLWAWKALGDYYGKIDVVEECYQKHLGILSEKRAGLAPLPFLPTPKR